MLKSIAFKGRSHEHEQGSSTSTEKTQHQRQWIPGTPGRPAVDPVPAFYSCCGTRCPDQCSCFFSSCCLNPDQPGSPAVPEAPGHYADDSDQSMPSSQTQMSGQHVARTGSIKFGAHLRTPVDPAPLPAALIMGEDDRPIDEGLLWTSSTMSVPRPQRPCALSETDPPFPHTRKLYCIIHQGRRFSPRL
jgi:hypothetical protein